MYCTPGGRFPYTSLWLKATSATVARQCAADIEYLADGPAQAAMMPPRNAYQSGTVVPLAGADNAAKLAGLQATAARLIESEKMRVTVFQEVRSAEVVKQLLVAMRST